MLPFGWFRNRNLVNILIDIMYFLTTFIGSATCKLQIFSLDICYGASMLSLVVISIERYYAVCKPTEFEKLKQKTIVMIITIWIASGLVYVPMLWACEKRPSGDNRQLSCNCHSKWGPWYNYAVYGTLIVVILYLLPLTAMLFSYVPVIKRLWGSQLKRSSKAQAESNHQKKRVTKMLIVVVMLFFVSWTPYNVLYMLKKYQVDFRHVYR